MNLIKLSTVLYPSLPGPKPRRMKIYAESIEPYYFDEGSARRAEIMLYIITIIATFYGGWALIKWAGIL